MRKIAVISAILLVVPLVAYATPVPDTGQTKCYDATQEITCPSVGEPFYGQDAQYTTSPQSYTKLDVSGNDLPDEATEWVMVRDNVTGLIWEVKTDDDTIHDKDDTYYWDGAQTFISSLNSSGFGGHSDWRLPPVDELMLIVNRDTYPKINISYFPSTIPDWYWASPITPHISYYAWVVYFNSGGVTYGQTSSDYGYVRAVRGNQLINNFLDNGDGTVTDSLTGLMWQQATAPGTYTWQQALSYCENLTLAEYDDWRLPDTNELQSIVDYGRNSPAIDTTYFPATMSTYYWSSTTNYGLDSDAWAFWLDDGAMDTRNKLDSSHNYYVRAVRCGLLDDIDCDGILNDEDNCPDEHNPNQEDTDQDAIGDECDNCPDIPNGSNLGTCVNAGTNTTGATCMFDNECNAGEICNNNQEDRDNDGSGDACDMMCKGLADYDQDVDGTDASMFKSHFGRSLFKNPCPPDGPAPVPKTGQTTFYGAGDDGHLQRGVEWPNPRFTNLDGLIPGQGDDVVLDNLTGLIWTKNANWLDIDGFTWEEARSYIAGMNGGTNENYGYTDWRFPNLKEFLSLLDYGAYNPALPSGNPFVNVQSEPFWTSTTYMNNGDYAWRVYTIDGRADQLLKIGHSLLWPVRGGH